MIEDSRSSVLGTLWILKKHINNNDHLFNILPYEAGFFIWFCRITMMWKLILQRFSRYLKNKILFSLTIKLTLTIN